MWKPPTQTPADNLHTLVRVNAADDLNQQWSSRPRIRHVHLQDNTIPIFHRDTDAKATPPHWFFQGFQQPCPTNPREASGLTPSRFYCSFFDPYSPDHWTNDGPDA
jgi:hypothetical protein